MYFNFLPPSFFFRIGKVIKYALDEDFSLSSFLIKICASEERFFHVSTLGSFISILVKRVPPKSCAFEESLFTFRHLEVLFQSR